MCYTLTSADMGNSKIEVALLSSNQNTLLTTLLKVGSYSSTTMCQCWDNHLIY